MNTERSFTDGFKDNKETSENKKNALSHQQEGHDGPGSLT